MTRAVNGIGSIITNGTSPMRCIHGSNGVCGYLYSCCEYVVISQQIVISFSGSSTRNYQNAGNARRSTGPSPVSVN